MKLHYLAIFFLFFSINLFGQTPFTCDGSFYISLSSGGTSQVYAITIDPVTNNVLFNPLANVTNSSVNAIGYRITDNLIYGVRPNTGDLYQIDATGNAILKTTLPFVTSTNNTVAGDITPDGDTLIVIESPDREDASLRKIELSSGNYNITTVPLILQSTGQAPTSRTADISIDPITGEMYGYNNNRILKYNTATGLVDDISFPIQSV